MLIYRWILIYLEEEKHVEINFHSHMWKYIRIHDVTCTLLYKMPHIHRLWRERENAYCMCVIAIAHWVYELLSHFLSILSLSLSFVSFLLSLCLSLAYVQLLDVRSSCQTGMKYEEEREMLISTRRIIINFEILFNLYKNQLIIYLIVFFLLLYILFYIQNENLQFIFIKFSFMRIHKRFT